MFDWFKKQPSPKEVEKRIDALNLDVLSCFYIMADDGKDKLVNRHLQKRADHLEQHYERMAKRANKASTRHGRA